ncbi:MAG: hypothetical protein KatS3mg110_3898 [Pirellulaceae bacterium]|nr:MAG: hypothetical protein KatS3mg110_3898 [Pirellulaceae bacterium]
MPETPPKAVFEHQPGDLEASLNFLKRTHAELRTLRRVRLWQNRLQVFDVNGDYFELRGVGYPDAEIVPLLRMVYAAFDPQTIHEPTSDPYKELLTGRRHPWAEDRVM